MKQFSISKSYGSWLSSFYLLLLVGGAAAGALLGFHPALILAVAALALISWELLAQRIDWRSGDRLPSLKVPLWAHIKVLMISAGSGLLLAEGGLLVHISLPFGIVVLAVLLILFSFSRFYRLIATR